MYTVQAIFFINYEGRHFKLPSDDSDIWNYKLMLSMPSKRTTPEPVKNKWSPSVKPLRLEIPYLFFFLVKFILIVKLSRLF